MKRMGNTLYLLTEDAYLSLDGENVVARRDWSEIGRVPLHTLEAILCFSYAGASPALMGACADRGVGLSFFTPRGRFLARVRRSEGQRAAEEEAVCAVGGRGGLVRRRALVHHGQGVQRPLGAGARAAGSRDAH